MNLFIVSSPSTIISLTPSDNRVVNLRVKLISLEIKLVLKYQFYFAKINTEKSPNFFSI